MTVTLWARAGGLGLGAFLVGCGAGGLHFAGQGQAVVVGPAQVLAGDRAPAAHRRLGNVSAECRPLDASDGVAGARLSDLSCSTQLLLGALRDAAAQAGGDFLLQPHCSGVPARPGKTLACAAEAWAPNDPAHFSRPPLQPAVNEDPEGPVAAGAPAAGSVADAWRVHVDFWPAAGQAERKGVEFGDVAELAHLGAGQVLLGELTAHCDGCVSSSARIGLFAAAARLGATSVVDVRCTRAESAISCVASGAAPEVDPGRLAEVR